MPVITAWPYSSWPPDPTDLNLNIPAETGDTAMFTAPAISTQPIPVVLAAAPRPLDPCDCGADLTARPAAGCVEPYGHLIVLDLGQLRIVSGAEPDGTIGTHFELPDTEDFARMTSAEARRLGAAFIQAADETDRLAALTA